MHRFGLWDFGLALHGTLGWVASVLILHVSYRLHIINKLAFTEDIQEEISSWSKGRLRLAGRRKNQLDFIDLRCV